MTVTFLTFRIASFMAMFSVIIAFELTRDIVQVCATVTTSAVEFTSLVRKPRQCPSTFG